MKRKFLFLAFMTMVAFVLLAACNQEKQEENQPAVLNVKIKTDDHIELNKETEIACLVTYGNEKVTDADEVKFEIWKQGNNQHEMLKAKHEGNGKYVVKKTFTEPGTYSVIAHVTARNMHNMPKTDIVVGQASNMPAEQNHDHDGEEHHDHHSDVTIMLHEQQYHVNEATELTAHITHDGQPLTNATVRFEVWKENSEKHEFIDAHEQAKGEYKATTTFKDKGVYFVKVHVETNELHDHQVEQITVQ
ncbi:FixH family protein [Thermaerobacillus caldiproteolyticus]|uniref:FixH family protein n=1 Tax=Thermaerobacillus caldiproteolyticus TaxID=247480 RepID=UPI0018F13130|nr:FixH family protein [Anoxybacillus caldiproteolyticus]